MISPKTALASDILEASSVCAFVKDFAGEPDSSHSGLIASMLRFEVLLIYKCWTSKLWSSSCCSLKLHSSLCCTVRLPTHAGILALTVPLWGLPLQDANDRRPTTMRTEIHNDFCTFCGTAEVHQDVLDIFAIALPLFL